MLVLSSSGPRLQDQDGRRRLAMSDGPGLTRRTGQGRVMPKRFLATGSQLGSLKRAADRADHRDEDASSDKTGDQIADPTAAERDAEEAH